MPVVAGKEIKMDKYNQDDYDFIEDEEFQAFLQSKLKGRFLPFNRFMTLLNRCKKEYIFYLNHKYLYINRPLY